MNFPSILILVIIWVLAGLVSSGKKKAQQQTARNAKPGKAGSGTTKQQAEPKKPSPAAPVRPAVLQPSISVTEHDDSIYQGSLNADTGEGYDPCHDGQLSALSAAEREPLSVTSEAAPGLRLGWSGNEIVRGFVMGEILTRRKNRAS